MVVIQSGAPKENGYTLSEKRVDPSLKMGKPVLGIG